MDDVVVVVEVVVVWGINGLSSSFYRCPIQNDLLFAISSLRQANFPQTVFMDALLVFPLSPKFKGRFGEILQSKRRVREALVEVTEVFG